jgi:hypothetical protein
MSLMPIKNENNESVLVQGVEAGLVPTVERKEFTWSVKV